MAETNASPNEATQPVNSIDTANVATAQPRGTQPQGQELYPNGVPNPPGTDLKQERESDGDASSDPTTGTGVEGELDVWQARYSMRNFIGRALLRSLATLGACVLAYYLWAEGRDELRVLTWIAIGVVALLWAGLIFRMIQTHYSHYYRLTNRRLFVSTGIVNRRRDMLELLRVKDVFTRQQSLLDRWLGLGTVVVEPNDKSLPTFYLAGVNDPKEVMDLIWHHARSERDERSVKVDSV